MPERARGVSPGRRQQGKLAKRVAARARWATARGAGGASSAGVRGREQRPGGATHETRRVRLVRLRARHARRPVPGADARLAIWSRGGARDVHQGGAHQTSGHDRRGGLRGGLRGNAGGQGGDRARGRRGGRRHRRHQGRGRRGRQPPGVCGERRRAGGKRPGCRDGCGGGDLDARGVGRGDGARVRGEREGWRVCLQRRRVARRGRRRRRRSVAAAPPTTRACAARASLETSRRRGLRRRRGRGHRTGREGAGS